MICIVTSQTEKQREYPRPEGSVEPSESGNMYTLNSTRVIYSKIFPELMLAVTLRVAYQDVYGTMSLKKLENN